MAVALGGFALNAIGHVVGDKSNHAQMSCKSGLVVGLLDGDSVGKTEGIFVGALLDGSRDVCKEGMIVGEAAVTGRASSTTVSKIATMFGRSRRKMVSLKKGVNSSGDGRARESIESTGQKHWFGSESSKRILLFVSARDRPDSRLKASLNNFVLCLHPRKIPLTRNTNQNLLAMVVLF